MALPLSNALIEEKNELESNSAWILLLTLTNVDQTITLRFARNTENVEYDGNTYIAFPFEISEITDEIRGKIATASIKVSNVDRAVQAYVEQDETFGSGWDVKISLVHENNLADGSLAELEYTFKSTNCVCDVEFATFNLGLPNPLLMQVPCQKFIGGNCQRVFKSEGCGYSGVESQCAKTLEACNTYFPDGRLVNGVNIGIPFLGFLGMQQRAIYET